MCGIVKELINLIIILKKKKPFQLDFYKVELSWFKLLLQSHRLGDLYTWNIPFSVLGAQVQGQGARMVRFMCSSLSGYRHLTCYILRKWLLASLYN